jgi:hypothetical protein
LSLSGDEIKDLTGIEECFTQEKQGEKGEKGHQLATNDIKKV